MSDGWDVRALGEVCDFIGRGISPRYVDEGGLVVLNQRCIRAHRVNFEEARRHDPDRTSFPERKFVRQGDVLVNSTGVGTLGRVAQVKSEPTEPTTVDGHVTILRPRAGMFDPDFFGYALMSIEEQIARAGTGSGGQTELSRSALEEFKISFPTNLAVQRRISQTLEAALSALHTAEGAAKESVRLAVQLRESRLKEIFSREEIARWPMTPLGTVTDIQSGGTPRVATKEYWGGDITWFSSGELGQDFVESSERSITPLGLSESNAKVFPAGSLLIGMYDTAALKMSLLTQSAAFNQAIAGVKSSERLDTYFAMMGIASRRSEILAQRRGVRQKNLSLRKIKAIEIPVPPIEIQKEVVAQFLRLVPKADILRDIEQHKMTLLGDLRQRLVKEACGAYA